MAYSSGSEIIDWGGGERGRKITEDETQGSIKEKKRGKRSSHCAQNRTVRSKEKYGLGGARSGSPQGVL